MADQLTFHGWARGAAAAQADQISKGRLAGELTLKTASSTGEPLPEHTIAFEFYGPADVRTLQPGAIRRRYPHPGAADVDPDYCAYVEFSDPDLPWRYSLLANSANPDAVKPWLVLVVGTADEISLLPGGQAVLRGEVKKIHDLNNSAAWAHVQRENDQVRAARLLSPRNVGAQKTTWFALLVPTFRDNGSLRWNANANPVTVPVYSWWSFQTGETLGFVELARRLAPERPERGLGYAPLAYQAAPAEDLTPQLTAAGALVSPPPANEPDPRRTDLPAEIKDHFESLLEAAGLPRDAFGRVVDPSDSGRPLVLLPEYGEPWFELSLLSRPQWAKELNADPRLRGAAGLGTWAAIEWQEKIVTAATRQMGALSVAAQRLRQLTFGLEATRRLWDRRLLPASLEERLLIIGPSMMRMATPDGSSLLANITRSGRPLPNAVFSSAGRRVLRPRGPLGRRAAPGAMAPTLWLEALNDCERFAQPQLESGGMLHAESIGFSDAHLEIANLRQECGDDLSAYRERFSLSPEGWQGIAALQEEENSELESAGAPIAEWMGGFDQKLFNKGLDEGDSARRFFEEASTEVPYLDCRAQRVKLDKLDARLIKALDPTVERPFIVERVLRTIAGLDDQPLAPPELCLDFHIPAWQFLRDYEMSWLLPGVDHLVVYQQDAAGERILDEQGNPIPDPDKDPVVAVETNSPFTDAFMIGFNQQALQELRWRNIPVQTGCTPLRRFWEPIGVRPADPPHPNAGKPDTLEDIHGIHLWGDTPLGDPSHETPAASGSNLALVFKTPLFRRYPSTLVYLVPRQAGDVEWNGVPDWAAGRLEPNMQAVLEKDTVMFGFERGKDVLEDHWLVIEQIPAGYNFFNHAGALPTAARQAAYQNAGDGGRFATAAFVNPVRLIIQGTKMLAKEA